MPTAAAFSLYRLPACSPPHALCNATICVRMARISRAAFLAPLPPAQHTAVLAVGWLGSSAHAACVALCSYTIRGKSTAAARAPRRLRAVSLSARNARSLRVRAAARDISRTPRATTQRACRCAPPLRFCGMVSSDLLWAATLALPFSSSRATRARHARCRVAGWFARTRALCARAATLPRPHARGSTLPAEGDGVILCN